MIGGNVDRFLMEDLIKWKRSKRRKPLILNGARQVGKTWLLKEFGRTQFDNVAYVSFDDNPLMAAAFNEGYDIPRLIMSLQAVTGERIDPATTLIIFDEVQECPKALTSLKYFCENAPEYHVAAAGSLLGILVHEGTGFPVGKVNTLNLHPLSYREFLHATGNGQLCDLIDSGDTAMIETFALRFTQLLRQYYFVGGMPEAVAAFVDTGVLADAREIQGQILFGYERDISKHLSAKETEFTLAAWKSVPSHLGQENKRFVFGHIKDGARARDYRLAITWLTQAGMAILVRRISKPGIPLAPYADDTIFKLFTLDVGLLGAMAGLDETSVIAGNSAFTEFKGALTEQYVCQQLVSDCGLAPYYWSAENSSGEIDFLVQGSSSLYAIEVKAEENLRAKSLRAFRTAHPEAKALRFSMSGYREQDWMRNVPLYAIANKVLWG